MTTIVEYLRSTGHYELERKSLKKKKEDFLYFIIDIELMSFPRPHRFSRVRTDERIENAGHIFFFLCLSVRAGAY